ncbi:MAG: paraquat-inducible protein A [gamma proteobacterium symbiont of Bathyaustriella thionipta]|nr:paraquat-inducible protein A [gamma proteobacterium symbiont of Bathyaustriella thionipta]
MQVFHALLSRKFSLNLLLIIAGVLLTSGLSMPFFTIHKFIIFDNQVSLLSAIAQLWQQGNWFLSIIIGLFSLFLPIVKILVIALFWNSHHRGQYRNFWMKHMAWLGKWSMLDVFVVALLVVSVKLRGLAEVEIHAGLYAFALAALLTMAVGHLALKYSIDKELQP